MNKKGFTLVELITTFALTAVIVIILINISIMIRNTYNKIEIKTQLLIEQANLSSAINSKINKDNLVDYENCNDSNFCYNFNLKDGSVVKLVITNTTIKFDDYVYKLNNGTKVENPIISKVAVSLEESSDSEFLVIKIPIINKLYPNEDFGINIVYQYSIDYKEINKKICRLVYGMSKEVGSKYICSLDKDRPFYVLENNESSNKITLLMDQNYTDDTVPLTMPWCDQNGPYPDSNECNHDGLDPYVEYTQTKFGNRVIVGVPSAEQMIAVGCKNEDNSCPQWTCDYLKESANPVEGVYGYWTSTADKNSNSTYAAYYVSSFSYNTGGRNVITSYSVSYTSYGFRPVITISKFLLD